MDSKFKCGQKVFLFNSISMEIEEDFVYAVLYVPVQVSGSEPDSSKGIAEKIADGSMEVREQYQLAQHQGVLDSECLFASEADCRKYFREFFY